MLFQRQSRSVFATVLLLGLAAATTGYADDCDYVGRHYKTDIAPTGGTTYPASRSGDITYSAVVVIDIRNVGVNPIQDLAPPGSLVHARRIALNVKGRQLYGWLPAPFVPGATASVAFDLPEGLLGACERATFTIDADRSLGQAGCQVHANDAVSFRAFFDPRVCVLDGAVGAADEEAQDDLYLNE